MRNISLGFFTLEDYLRNEKHLNRWPISRELSEYLINKMTENPSLECMIQERGDKAIIFVPVSLIKAGKAEKGMLDKNIITVWYRKDHIKIEIEPEDKEKYYQKEEINDAVLERIYIRYQKLELEY